MGLIDYFKKQKQDKQKDKSDVFANPTIVINGDEKDTSGPPQPLSIPAIYRGIDTIASSVAGLPLDIYKRKDDGGREKDKDNPWFDILKYQPNAFQNANAFWKSAIMQRFIYGNCFVFIDRLDRELKFLPPDRTKSIIVDDELSQYHGKKFFIVQPKKDKDKKELGQWQAYDHTEVLHLHTMPVVADSDMGMPLAELFKMHIGAAVDLDKYTTCLLNNGGIQRGYIQLPGTLGKEAKAELSRQFSFIYDNSKKRKVITPVLFGGAEFKTLNFTPHELQLIEKKKDLITDIANILGIQLHLINSLEKANYNSLEAQGRDYLAKTIQPILNEIVGELNTKLFTRDERKALYAEHNTKQLLQIDATTEATILDKYIKASVMSQNEARARLNLPAIEGGDSYFLPTNMADSQLWQQKMELDLAKSQQHIEARQQQIEQQAQARADELAQQQAQQEAEQADAAAEADAERITNAFERIARRYERLISAEYGRQAKAQDQDKPTDGADDGEGARPQPSIAEPLRAILEALAADVAEVFPSYTPSNNYQALAEAYAGGQALRFNQDKRSPAYEANRAINAHARIVYAEHGVAVKWIGGELDGVERPPSVPFIDKGEDQPFAVMHPPISFEQSDFTSWIVPAEPIKKSAK